MKVSLPTVLLVALLVGGALFAPTPKPTTHQHVYTASYTLERDGSGNPTGGLILPSTPNPLTSVRVHLDGIRLKVAEDFTLTGNVVKPISFWAPSFIDPASIIVLDYDR